MHLIPDHSYEVLDYMGQVSFAAKYLGRLKDVDHRVFHDLFLFEIQPRIDKLGGLYKLVGCELLCRVCSVGIVTPYLRATHYGNSLEELEKCGQSKHHSPKWELM